MKKNMKPVFLLLLLILSISLGSTKSATSQNTLYQIGVGIADVTGPSAEIGMMGYANPAQSARGIHTRLFSRAFVFQERNSRVAFVSVDIAMMDQSIKRKSVGTGSQAVGTALIGFRILSNSILKTT